MKRFPEPAAVLLCLILPATLAAEPGRDDYYERAMKGRELRIQSANRQFDARVATDLPGTQALALFSLDRKITLAELAALLANCGCELKEIGRTVGETQFARSATNSALADEAFSRGAAADLQNALEGKSEIAPPPLDDGDDRWAVQKKAAHSSALAELRARGMLVNGFLVAGPLSALAALRARAGSQVLAVELLQGSGRPFVIPLETYR